MVSGIKSAAEKRKEQEEKEKKAVSCIVKFRPCKDWRGEYGFDWVREGKDDFEERIDMGNSVETSKSIVPPEKLKEFTEESEAFLNSYGVTREEFPGVYDDPILKTYVDAKIDEYTKSNPKELLKLPWMSAWKNSVEQFDDSNLNLKVDKGENPMEYAYHAKFIKKVSYKSESVTENVNGVETKIGNIWYRDFYEYEDMANGSKEVEDELKSSDSSEALLKPLRLYSFVDKPGFRLSILSGNKIPYYTDYGTHDVSRFCKRNETVELSKKTDSESYCVKAKNMVKGFLKGKYGNQHMIFIQRLDPEYWWNYVEFQPFLSQKDIQFTDTKKNLQYNLNYVVFADGFLLQAEVNALVRNGESCRCIIENGQINEVMVSNSFLDPKGTLFKTAWATVAELKKKGKYEDAERWVKGYFTDQMIANEMMDIKCLADQIQFEDISLSITNPTSLEQYTIEGPLLKETENGKSYWGGYRIMSWPDWYKASFLPAEYVLKKDDKLEDRDYTVPVLSVLTEKDSNRTRFEFRSPKDAPRKTKEKANEYKLQLRIEGDCPKLRFGTNNPNVKVDPKEIESPKDKAEITVKLAQGSEPCKPSVFAYCVDDDHNEEEVGRLEININDPMEIRVVFINVSIDDIQISNEYKDSLQDQRDALINALSQAGIRPRFFHYEVNLSSRTVNAYNTAVGLDVDKKINKKCIGEVIIDEFMKKYKDMYIMPYEYLFLFLDKNWVKRCGSAYSNTYDNGKIIFHYTFFSNVIANHRCAAYTVAHELGHSLDLPHHFQLFGWRNSRFCFPIATSSNVMDYYTLDYSLHRYQCVTMRDSLESHNQWIEDNYQRIVEEKRAEEKKKKKKGSKNSDPEPQNVNQAIISDMKKYRKII